MFLVPSCLDKHAEAENVLERGNLVLEPISILVFGVCRLNVIF